MENNLSIPDKIIRISLAILISVLLFSEVIPHNLALIVMVPAGIFLLTGIFGYCPLYTALGVRTGK
ncbi:MAG TPA: DUF2892 domain-containing protein [Salinimicrobium catena]|uniref:DUF2892 domain-containing protein n=1 Tax=Salinimicrobium catena TaxID=390640 RepID=A0A7C2RDC8_9FLAO|nr:DUF2892 domain-containing protein [Salinimicrobium catena]